jgi:NAD-reducing hydrogenase small subunit
MSFLDLDERLLALGRRIDLVYSPLADEKEFPRGVDVCLVEGAVSTSADRDLLRVARERTRAIVALGDCAANGNVTAMRDARGGAAAILRRAWPCAPGRDPALPALLDRVLPLHAVVPVDAFLPGCPPAPEIIERGLYAALAGARGAVAG